MEKVSKAELARLTGYSQPVVFHQWNKGVKNKGVFTPATDETKFRYMALLIGATLLKNGFGLSASLSLAEKNIDLEKEIHNLADEIEGKK